MQFQSCYFVVLVLVPRVDIIRFRKKVLQVACKQQSADSYHHKFEKWYRNAIATKQPSEHYYLSHATFPFSVNRFLCPAVEYSRFLAIWVNFWLLSNYCVPISFIKLLCHSQRSSKYSPTGCSGSISNCMYVHAAALLQRQFLKLHTSALQSLSVAQQ
jgi:hypothetical protein